MCPEGKAYSYRQFRSVMDNPEGTGRQSPLFTAIGPHLFTVLRTDRCILLTKQYGENHGRET
jgi:hypothetical protein